MVSVPRAWRRCSGNTVRPSDLHLLLAQWITALRKSNLGHVAGVKPEDGLDDLQRLVDPCVASDGQIRVFANALPTLCVQLLGYVRKLLVQLVRLPQDTKIPPAAAHKLVGKVVVTHVTHFLRCGSGSALGAVGVDAYASVV